MFLIKEKTYIHWLTYGGSLTIGLVFNSFLQIYPFNMLLLLLNNKHNTFIATAISALHMVMKRNREREIFYLTTHSTHFIYGYMVSDIWLRTILIVRKETHCRHIGYSYRLTARVLLYAPSHRHDNTYHSLCYTSRGALAETRNSSMGPPHEGSIRRPTAPWANALPLSYVEQEPYWTCLGLFCHWATLCSFDT